MSTQAANLAPLNNIRVFVEWAEQTVFAGEDIECEITFKNIASSPSPSRTSLHPPAANGFEPGPDRRRRSLVAPLKQSRPGPPYKGHRSTLSLNVPVGSVRSQPVSGSWSAGPSKSGKDWASHKRSVSIISIGASEGATDDANSHRSFAERPRGGSRGHGRSASLQIVPRRHGITGGPTSAPITQRSSTQPSPIFAFPAAPDHKSQDRSSRPKIGISSTNSALRNTAPPTARKIGSGSFLQGFKFPADSPSLPDSGTGDELDKNREENAKLLSPSSRDISLAALQQAAPGTRVLSAASMSGTPRSSGEFYSLSNNSTETLASEYLPSLPGRLQSNGNLARTSSNLSPTNYQKLSETLMMGYAQIHGSFTVDGSLISQAPFEDVKRKGVVGGQGGGVIGIDTNKRDSGLLGNFGWSSIGDSLGGLLGGGDFSSMKEMRGIASSRSIPLLSTPQSLLFIDLKLSPGESRSYAYSFKLPRGLPPSHRGKAIKISYKLIIGTQRPGGAKEQQVKSVDVPFRILGSVNSHGELLGHDLMSPYIILRDQARIRPLEIPPLPKSFKNSKVKPALDPNGSKLADFHSYIDELLTRPRQNSNAGLLSPTEAPRSQRRSSIAEPSTAKEAIDMAILRSNIATESQQSANRFEIARSGKRVAVVMLARPAFRLGETVIAAIDFTNAEIPCYAIHATLESSERIDNSIALRSESSILRVTRKTFVSHSESALFARRVVFSPTIPVSATPEFMTSGVSLDWRIRVEFVTPRLSAEAHEIDEGYNDLLEEVLRDDRGIVLAAADALDCETFEVAVPLRVYGALTGNTEKDEAPADGLEV